MKWEKLFVSLQSHLKTFNIYSFQWAGNILRCKVSTITLNSQLSTKFLDKQAIKQMSIY